MNGQTATLEKPPPAEAQNPTPAPVYSPAPAPDDMRLGDALRRHWLVITFCIVLFGAGGAAAALTREPSWSASTGMIVGENNLSVQSIPGFAVGGQAVADSLSRAVTAPGIVNPAARRLGLSPDYVAGHVSATPVSRTAVLTVVGTGADEREAVAITNAVAASMRRYADVTQSGLTQRGALIDRYQRAYRRQVAAEQEVSRLRKADASDGRIVDARAEAELRRVSASALREDVEAKDAQKASGAVVNLLTPARTAYSDRSSKLQLFLVIGVVAGALFGSGIALLLERRRRGIRAAAA